jgi:tRNA (guanine-N7-)-methyltransferase
MRIRRKPWAREELAACGFYIRDGCPHRGRWDEVFGNGNPIYADLGCGKGGFAARLAVDNPEINVVAVDIKSEMLGVARRKIESAFQEKTPENIRLLTCEISFISSVFSIDDNIAGLYINFCNPWHKARHKNRRLTYPRMLEQYKTFLKSGCEIRFKTDDGDFFDESIEYFEQTGYDVVFVTRDLHASGDGGIITEHEAMFMGEGKSIKSLIAKNV